MVQYFNMVNIVKQSENLIAAGLREPGPHFGGLPPPNSNDLYHLYTD